MCLALSEMCLWCYTAAAQIFISYIYEHMTTLF